MITDLLPKHVPMMVWQIPENRPEVRCLVEIGEALACSRRPVSALSFCCGDLPGEENQCS